MRERLSRYACALHARHQRQVQPSAAASSQPPIRTGACSAKRWRITLAGMPGAAHGAT
jgi:hypothetical protein